MEMTIQAGEPDRQCGGCTLCCRLVPVETLNKGAGERCRHQRFRTGCAVWHKEGFPAECALWNCRWLINDDMDGMKRPDRAHYVVDLVPDFITAEAPGRGDVHVPVVQIWVDPHYPDAHRDPELRAWIARQKGYCALVRFDASHAIVLIPPYWSDTGDWEEVGSNRAIIEDRTHSAEEIFAKLTQAGIKG